MSINFAFLKNELKNKRIVALFYTIALVLGFILLTVVSNNSYKSFGSREFGVYFLIFSTSLYVFMFFILSLYQLDFFHTKKKLDVYHSLPITRNSLFLTNILVVPIILMVPYFLMNIINIEVSKILFVSPYTNQIGFQRGLYYGILLRLFVISIFSYSIMVLVSTITTNKVMHGIVTIALACSPFILIFCINYFFSTVINYGINSEQALVYTYQFITASDVRSFSNTNYFGLVSQLIISVIFYVLAFYSYNNFKSENVTKKITNKIVEKVFIAIVSFSISLMLVLLLMEVGLYSAPMVSISFLVLFSFVFLASNWLIRKEIEVKPYLISLGVCCVFLFISFFDIFRLGNYAPKEEDVTYIQIGDRVISKELYREVRDMQKGLFSDKFIDTMGTDRYSFERIRISYYTNKDFQVERVYGKGDFSFYSELENIVEKEANRQEALSGLENFKDEVESYESIYGSYSLFGVGESLPVREYDRLSGSYYTTEHISIIDALIKDIEADEYFTSFTDTNAVIGNIEIGGYSENPLYSYKRTSVPIKSTYKNTLKYLQSLQSSDIYKGKALVIAENVYLNDDIDKALANGVEFVDVDLDLEVNPTETDVYVQGDNDSRTYGNTTFDELYEYTVSSTGYNEVHTIKYDENPEEFLDMINNKIVNYNIEQVLPVEEGTVFSAYIFSEYDANTKKLTDTYTTVEIKGDIKNIETNVRYVGSFYE